MIDFSDSFATVQGVVSALKVSQALFSAGGVACLQIVSERDGTTHGHLLTKEDAEGLIRAIQERMKRMEPKPDDWRNNIAIGVALPDNNPNWRDNMAMGMKPIENQLKDNATLGWPKQTEGKQ